MYIYKSWSNNKYKAKINYRSQKQIESMFGFVVKKNNFVKLIFDRNELNVNWLMFRCIHVIVEFPLIDLTGESMEKW